MEDIFDDELTPDRKAEFIRQIDEYLVKLQQMQEQSVKDWEEIDRINAETEAILARLREQMQKAA